MAMAVQGLPRATHDMDFFVSPARENIEKLKRALRGLYDDPNVDEIDAAELAYGLRPWRFTPGVEKFRTMEEANLHRASWEREQVRGRNLLGGTTAQ